MVHKLTSKAYELRLLSSRFYWGAGGGLEYIENKAKQSAQRFPSHPFWETDFHTPPVLGAAALFDNSAPAVYKNPVPQGSWILYAAGAELSKRAAAPSTGGVWKSVSQSCPGAKQL